MIKFNDLHKQYLSIKSEVDKAIASVINESAFIGGKYVTSFENSFGSYHDVDYCLGVANGTDALEIAIESFNLPQGSEVIVPANSFVSSAECVLRMGYKVIFCDVSPDNYTIDINDLSKRITTNTSLIIAVHLYGHPCDMDEIIKIAKNNNIRVIEDCAQAHGAKYKNKKIGSIGDLGCFSFYPGKNLGAYGDGGAILSNDSELINYCRKISNHGRLNKFDHDLVGRNSRLDGIQAAILDVKLKYLDEWTEIRNNVAIHYINNLSSCPHIILPKSNDNIYHSYHLFVIRHNNRDQLRSALLNNGIESGIHYPLAIPNLTAFKNIDINLSLIHI